MPLSFTQEELERELADIISHGDRVELARMSGLSESYIKRQFNADDHEAVSSAFRLLQIGCAFDDIDTDKGDQFWQSIARFRELSRKRKSGGKRSSSHAIGELGKEVAELIAAALEKKPFVVQIRELGDVERRIAEAKEHLLAEFNDAKEQSPARLRRVI